MHNIKLYIVTTDPRAGEGGKWIAATPWPRDAADIADLLGGVVSDTTVEAVESDGAIRFIGTSGCKIYYSAYDCAAELAPPEVIRYMDKAIDRAMHAVRDIYSPPTPPKK